MQANNHSASMPAQTGVEMTSNPTPMATRWQIPVNLTRTVDRQAFSFPHELFRPHDLFTQTGQRNKVG